MQKVTTETTKPLKNVCGIYKIKIKKHTYIGSSNHIGNRLRQHLQTLRHGKHHNHTMQNCFNKYGADEMEFEVVEQCKEDIRIEREAYYIKTLNPDMNHIIDPVNIVRDADTIERTRQSQIIYYQTHLPVNAKKVYQYGKDGKFIKE